MVDVSGYYLVNNESAKDLFSKFDLELVTYEYECGEHSFLIGEGIDMGFDDVAFTENGILFICHSYNKVTEEFANYISTLKIDDDKGWQIWQES